MAEKNILVTGGAGYIGSHTVVQLLNADFKVVVVDNLDNSSEIAIKRAVELAGDKGKNLSFHKMDLRDRKALDGIFSSSKGELDKFRRPYRIMMSAKLQKKFKILEKGLGHVWGTF